MAAVGIAVYTVVKASKWIFGNDGILDYAVSTAVTHNMGKWIIQILGAALIPILILVYNMVMKDKQQNSWPHFIVLLIVALQTIFAVYSCIVWLLGMFINPIFAIIGLGSVCLTLFGNVNIAVGCIDFCRKATSEFVINNPQQQINNNQPNQQNQQQQNQRQQQNQQQPNQPNQQYQPYQQIQPILSNESKENVNTSSEETKFCNQCGAIILNDAVFCPKCGAKLKD